MAELTLEQLQAAAQRRGLTLPQEELLKLLPGVIRARRQAAELRDLVKLSDEPPATCNAQRDNGN